MTHSAGDVHEAHGEANLVRRAKAGDKVALLTLLTLAGKPVRDRIAWRRRSLPESAEFDVGDIQQEVYVLAMKAIDSFEYRHEGSFNHWVCSIADAHINRLARSAIRRQRRHLEHHHRLARVVGRSAGWHGKDLADAEAMRVILGSMRSLQPSYEQLLRMRYIEHRTKEEMAQILDRPVKSINNSLRRALKALRDELGTTSRYV